MSSNPGPRRVSAGRLAVAVALIGLGVALWITSGAPAYGLVSGLGVVIGYAALEPWLERWRNT